MSITSHSHGSRWETDFPLSATVMGEHSSLVGGEPVHVGLLVRVTIWGDCPLLLSVRLSGVERPTGMFSQPPKPAVWQLESSNYHMEGDLESMQGVRPCADVAQGDTSAGV